MEVPMKFQKAVLVLTLLLGVTAFAQPRRVSPQERTDQLAKQLELTDEQKAKVLEMFTKEEESRPKPSPDGSFDREAMRARMQKIREERSAQLKTILTKEQYEKYESLQNDMRQGRGGQNPGGRPPRLSPQERTDQLVKQLSLSDDQKAKVLEVLTNDEKNMPKPSGDSQSDREAMRAKMEKAREERDAKLKAIFTAEQYEKYTKLRSEMPPGGMERKAE
jgi:protein CpxP